VQGEQLVMKRLVSEFPDWRTMRGMVASGPSLTKALEQEHRDEIAKHNDRLVILYSWALLAWIRNESSAPRVDEILSQAERGELLLSMSWINAGEVFYVLGRKHSQKVADEFLTRLPSLPIRLVLPDESPALESARLKANRRISYADASADSLARREAAVLVTGDPELRSLENWVTLEWIGEALH
jgi:predicted nucleic acid-binding protein